MTEGIKQLGEGRTFTQRTSKHACRVKRVVPGDDEESGWFLDAARPTVATISCRTICYAGRTAYGLRDVLVLCRARYL